MSYSKQIGEWLGELLKQLPADDAVTAIAEIKKKLLESYRNGQRDCPKCNPRKPRFHMPRRSEAKPR